MPAHALTTGLTFRAARIRSDETLRILVVPPHG